MPYNTNNPVPSSDLRDFYDNNLTIDEIVNSSAKKTITRTGKEINTWSGFQDDVNKISQQAAQSASDSEASAIRAKTEADRAAQANPNNWESAPYPDVWIPFNDSLKMEAGFGAQDTITVGAETIKLPSRSATFTRASTATYIDKSGVLQTAAVNEPRFEKEGLLIEGQSTNLFPYSENFLGTLPGGKFDIFSSNLTGVKNADGSTTFSNNAASPNTTGSAARRMLLSSAMTITGGTTHTLTFMGKGGTHQLVIYGTGLTQQGGDITFPEDRFGTASFTFTSLAAGGTFQCEIYANPSTGGHSTYNGSFSLRYFQIEALPFATSYIPTNGTAVTRAAEKCSIDTPGNIVKDSCTISINYDLNLPFNTIADRRLIEFGGNGGGGTDRAMFHLSHATKKMTCFWGSTAGGQQLEVTPPSAQPNLMAVARSGATGRMVVDKVLTTKTDMSTALNILSSRIWIGGAVTGANNELNGHVRNFRIWHRALTDAQLKSLR